MKVVYLALQNIKKMIKNHKVMFFQIFFSVIIFTIGILFFTGYIAETYYQNQSDEKEVLNITLNSGSGEEVQNLITALENKNASRILVWNEDSLIDDKQFVMGEYNENYEKRLLIGNMPETNEAKAVAVISQDQAEFLDFEKTPLDAKMKIGNTFFNVVGVVSFTDQDEIVIPISYYVENYQTSNIKYTYKNGLTKKEKNAISNILDYSDLVQEYVFAENSNILFSFDFWIQFIQILFIFIVTIINVFFLVYYLVYRMKRNYNVYSLCGGNRCTIFKILLFQTYIVMIAGILAGFILFDIFAYVIRNTGLILQNNFSFYSGICLFMLVITLVFSAIVGKKVNYKNQIYRMME